MGRIYALLTGPRCYRIFGRPERSSNVVESIGNYSMSLGRGRSTLESYSDRKRAVSHCCRFILFLHFIGFFSYYLGVTLQPRGAKYSHWIGRLEICHIFSSASIWRKVSATPVFCIGFSFLITFFKARWKNDGSRISTFYHYLAEGKRLG